MAMGHLPKDWSCRDSDIKPINWIIRWLILPTVILRETWSTSAASWSPTPSLHCGSMYSIQYLSISVSKQHLYFYVYIAFCSCAQTQKQWGEVSVGHVGLAAVGQSEQNCFLMVLHSEKTFRDSSCCLPALLYCFTVGWLSEKMRPCVAVRACINKG